MPSAYEEFPAAVQHFEAGRLDEAGTILERIRAETPQHVDAWQYLGVIAFQRGQQDRAIDCLRHANSLEERAGFLNNLSVLYALQRRFDEAKAVLLRSRELEPGNPEVHFNLGNVCHELGQTDEALASYRQALHLKPDYIEALNNVSYILQENHLLDEAEASYHRLLAINPDFAEAHVNIGHVFKDQGRLEESIAAATRALELKPDLFVALNNQLYTRLFCPGVDAPTQLAEHRAGLKRFAVSPLPPTDVDRSPERRLRVGYVSPDFCDHVVGRNLVPLFRYHDHTAFQIHCFSTVRQSDALTERIRNYADAWHEVIGLNDEQLAAKVREDRIDIFIDLSLHMSSNRLLGFARKPAPVQITFAGYPGTTGLDAIDYRLTDSHLDPPGLHDDWYSEQSLRLPHSFWCYDPLGTDVAVNALPAGPSGSVTFGCLNNFCKINSRTLTLWASVLRQVPGSRLLLLAWPGSHRQRVIDLLVAEGVAADRVTFVSNGPQAEYLRDYHAIDIGLDTLPYNGHTTSLDSFWMGVPVVTLVGETVVGRAGLSQLTNLGLPELIARDEDQFVKIAVDLAADRPRLAALRANLRKIMQASPLMDAPQFARGIEAAYREAWRRWCSRQRTLGSVSV